MTAVKKDSLQTRLTHALEDSHWKSRRDDSEIAKMTQQLSRVKKFAVTKERELQLMIEKIQQELEKNETKYEELKAVVEEAIGEAEKEERKKEEKRERTEGRWERRFVEDPGAGTKFQESRFVRNKSWNSPLFPK